MKTAFLALLILAGCASGPDRRLRSIRIDSEPPGARIFYGSGPNEESAAKGRNYLGTTPLVWETRADGGGYFEVSGIVAYSSFVQPVSIFFCEPAGDSTNLHAKTQIFHRPAIFNAGDKIPTGIFFDLKKP